MENQVTLADIVAGGVADAVAFVKTYYSVEDVMPFEKIVIALRSASASFHEEVSQGVLDSVYDQLGIDPKDTETVIKHLDLPAIILSDAIKFAVQQQQAEMQRRAMSEQALSNGQGHLLAN